MSYFYKDVAGLKSDIERHHIKELELLEKITELEHKTDEFSIISLKTYRNILNILRDSKAIVVCKIGKKLS